MATKTVLDVVLMAMAQRGDIEIIEPPDDTDPDTVRTESNIKHDEDDTTNCT